VIISQALKDVMELEKKIKRGEAILAPETMTPEELVSIRKGLELSQKDMAFKIGITSRQLRNLEDGKYLISKRIARKAYDLLVKGDTGTSNPPKLPLQTRIKPSSTEAENASPRLSEAQLEKITFCQNCGAPFRISEPVKKEVKPLIPREGTIPGPCPVCLKSPLVVRYVLSHLLLLAKSRD
jgi:DNA-binding transcriptional regulator YiaG